jgi:hypothetical protein
MLPDPPDFVAAAPLFFYAQLFSAKLLNYCIAAPKTQS